MQTTDFDVLDDPPAPVAVSVTVYVVFLANWCVMDTPDPVVPSPKFQLYDVALVVALASNVQERLEHDLVKLATGGCAIATVTDDVLLLVPLASVTVNVTE